MLPVQALQAPSRFHAFQFMQEYLYLLDIPFNAQYNKNGSIYVRIHNYKKYDAKFIDDIKVTCSQTHGYSLVNEDYIDLCYD